MDTQTMADVIIECVKNHPGATFIELIDACGPDARGDQALFYPGAETVIWWVRVSLQFAQAFNIAKPNLLPTFAGAAMCYLMDGSVPNLPILSPRAKKLPKKEHWLPVTFSWRSGMGIGQQS